MKDDFERYIKKNRENLDVEHPPEEVWQSVRREVGFDQRRRPGIMPHFWKIAALFLLTLSSVLAVLLFRSINDHEMQSLGDVSYKYRVMEKKYEKEIRQLTSSLDLDKLNDQEFAWMLEELETLDEINRKFRQDLTKNVNQDKVVRVLIDYYEKKIKLLKRIELEINRNDNEKKTSTI